MTTTNDPRAGQPTADTHSAHSGPANLDPKPMETAPGRLAKQPTTPKPSLAGPAIFSPTPTPNAPGRPAKQPTTPMGGTPAGPVNHEAAPEAEPPGRPAKVSAIPSASALADPALAIAADILDDIERTKIANENRLRSLTGHWADDDGTEHGMGLPAEHPDAVVVARFVAILADVEHQAVLHLQRSLRRHPLHEWVKAQAGIGEKQAARLLAAIGDPYWNHRDGRPRTVSELWQYSGHGDPARSRRRKRHNKDCDCGCGKVEHNPTAKMRTHLIADKVWQVGTRDGQPVTELAKVGHARKATTEGKLHKEPCVRCGPSGHPALPGSPWSDGHRHADALRVLGKEILFRLWLAARDIHPGHSSSGTHRSAAGVDHGSSDAQRPGVHPGQRPVDTHDHYAGVDIQSSYEAQDASDIHPSHIPGDTRRHRAGVDQTSSDTQRPDVHPGQSALDTHRGAAGVDQPDIDAQGSHVHPGQDRHDAHGTCAGVDHDPIDTHSPDVHPGQILSEAHSAAAGVDQPADTGAGVDAS